MFRVDSGEGKMVFQGIVWWFQENVVNLQRKNEVHE